MIIILIKMILGRILLLTPSCKRDDGLYAYAVTAFS